MSTNFPTQRDVITRAMLMSEVVDGCELTINGSTFSVGLGTLRFITMNGGGLARANTLIFPGITGVIPDFANDNNFITIDRSLEITQSNTAQEYTDLPDNIQIGLVITTPGLTPFFVTNDVNVNTQNLPGALFDLQRTLRPLKKSGAEFTHGASGNLEVRVKSGAILSLMLSKLISPSTPNVIAIADTTFSSYLYLYQDGGTGFTILPTTVVQPSDFDNGTGTLATLPANERWSVQRFYSFGDPTTLAVQFGQTPYKTLEDAALGVMIDEFIKFPALEGALFLGFLLVKKAATDLSDTAEAFFVNPPQVNGETNVKIQGT